jgi:hypothetical protein
VVGQSLNRKLQEIQVKFPCKSVRTSACRIIYFARDPRTVCNIIFVKDYLHLILSLNYVILEGFVSISILMFDCPQFKKQPCKNCEVLRTHTNKCVLPGYMYMYCYDTADITWGAGGVGQRGLMPPPHVIIFHADLVLQNMVNSDILPPQP